MNKPIALAITAALVASVAFPVGAVAKGRPEGAGKSQGAGRGHESVVTEGVDAPDKADAKQARKDAKVAAKAAKQAAKAERKALVVPDADEAAVDETLEASSTSEATTAPGPGITNAFSRITSNLEKSLAKVASGQKKQLPPGLVRVWLKFASWLGVDPITMPGTVSVSPTDPTGETSPTAEPTGTVAPTPTQPPTSTVESSVTPAP